MSLDQRNEARRFITLIDAAYENKVGFGMEICRSYRYLPGFQVKLFMSAETDLVELFSGEVSSIKDTGELVSAERLLMDDLKLQADQVRSFVFAFI